VKGLRHSYSARHLGLVGSHDRNLSVSASGVFDIVALYKLDDDDDDDDGDYYVLTLGTYDPEGVSKITGKIRK